jgi:hypothetical protein
LPFRMMMMMNPQILRRKKSMKLKKMDPYKANLECSISSLKIRGKN